MKLVEVKKTAIEVSPDDWRKLSSLIHDFNQICESNTCFTCPLTKFCEDHDGPVDYLTDLYKFLDD